VHVPDRRDGLAPRVKICGLTRREDALAAETAGAEYLGMILSSGFGRSVTLEAATALVRGLAATAVAVLVDEPEERVVEVAEAVGAGVVQLHGAEPPEMAARLAARGSFRVWKAVRARCLDDVARGIRLYGEVVDGILVEGWKEGAVGGAGARVDPGMAAGVRSLVPESIRLILAGGLTPENVSDAVTRFLPDVVDVSSGVEYERGIKDHTLIQRFMVEAGASRAPRGP